MTLYGRLSKEQRHFFSKTQDLSSLGQPCSQTEKKRYALLVEDLLDHWFFFFLFFFPSLLLPFQNVSINLCSVYGNPVYGLSLKKQLICKIQVRTLSPLSELSICFVISGVFCLSFIKSVFTYEGRRTNYWTEDLCSWYCIPSKS